MMEKGSVTSTDLWLPPLDHLENYQEIPEKWPFVVKKLEVFQLQGASQSNGSQVVVVSTALVIF